MAELEEERLGENEGGDGTQVWQEYYRMIKKIRLRALIFSVVYTVQVYI